MSVCIVNFVTKLIIFSVKTESQVLDSVLGNHTAKNIPKHVTKRKANVPNGPPRYDPSSQEWIEIMQNREDKENGTPKMKKKVSKKKAPITKVSKKSVPNATTKNKSKNINVRI